MSESVKRRQDWINAVEKLALESTRKRTRDRYSDEMIAYISDDEDDGRDQPIYTALGTLNP